MPRTCPVWVTDASLATVAMPKSATARRPRSSSSRLAGLDVAVDDVPRVGGVERGGGLAQPAHGRRARDRRPLRSRSATVPPAKYSMTMNGRPSSLADVEDRDDVRVVAEPRGGARLAGEAAHARSSCGVGGGQDLDRDEAPEDLVLGGPDAGHPAVGDVADEAVAVGQADRGGLG